MIMIDRNELHAMKTAARFDEFGNTRFPTMAKRAVELGLEPADSIKSEGMSCFARTNLGPTYTSHETFLRSPFCEDIHKVSEYDVAVVGIPYDSGASNRSGTRLGPAGIRHASSQISPFNPDYGEVPSAGDVFNAVADEKLARELVEQRKHEAKEEQFQQHQKVTLDNLFSQIAEGEMKELPIIVKADVQGSVEAVKQSLEKLSNDEVRVKVIHGGVGAVSESDVMLANASNAIIVGFNVRPDPVAKQNAEQSGVDIRLYRIIYDAIEEITDAMKGMLAPKYREVETARIEVRQVYKISNVGTVAGSYVLDGKVGRNNEIRVVRDGIVIAEDKMSSLKRFKDDAKEVAAGFECGITLEKFTDIKEGDIFEAFYMEEYRD